MGTVIGAACLAQQGMNISFATQGSSKTLVSDYGSSENSSRNICTLQILLSLVHILMFHSGVAEIISYDCFFLVVTGATLFCGTPCAASCNNLDHPDSALRRETACVNVPIGHSSREATEMIRASEPRDTSLFFFIYFRVLTPHRRHGNGCGPCGMP